MSGLAVGCRVVIHSRYGVSISKITRETKTQWIVSGVNPGSERRFRKSDLLEVGCSVWHIVRISGCTQEVEESISKRNLIHMIVKQGNFAKLSLDRLEKLWEEIK